MTIRNLESECIKASNAPPQRKPPPELVRPNLSWSGAGNLAMQRAAVAVSTVHPGPATRTALAQSVGEELPTRVRQSVVPMSEKDLDGVRVHTGTTAANAAQELRANAFTVGQDIYFGTGTYAPDTAAGQELLAHELTHTIQQRSASANPRLLSVASRSDPAEAEATATSRMVQRGAAGRNHVAQPVSPAQPRPAIRTTSTAVIQRQPVSNDEAAKPAVDKSPETKASEIKSVMTDYFSVSRKIKDIFVTAASPGEFIETQKFLDMDKVIDKLDAWDAVKVGSLGPIVGGKAKLNQKRAEYVIDAEFDYGATQAEVFVLFLFNTMYTDDMREVLRILADGRRINSIVNKMPSVKLVMAARGIKPDEFQDSSAPVKNFFRGIGRGIEHAADSSDVARSSTWQKQQYELRDLPNGYAEALGDIQQAEFTAALNHLSTPSGMAAAVLDQLTLGVSSGITGLVTGTVGAAKSAAEGDWERAGEQLTPAVLLLGTYLGVKAVRAVTATKPAIGPPAPGEILGPEGPGQFQIKGFKGPIPPEVARLGAILRLNAEGQAFGGLLLKRFGESGMSRLAQWIQADSNVAIFVHEHGFAALEALDESGGDLAKARTAVTAKPVSLLEAGETKLPGSPEEGNVKFPSPSEVSGKDKLDYLLGGVESEKSTGKGGFFKDVLGFNRASLEAALRKHRSDNWQTAEIRPPDRSYPGSTEMERRSVVGQMTGPNGRSAGVLSAWIVESDGMIRFNTAYPK